MATEINPTEKPLSPCWKKKPEGEGANFLRDLRANIDEFVHMSMDEHKECFKNTVQKMFKMSNIVGERSSEIKEVESCQTTSAE